MVQEYESTGELLVDLGSDQTSLHNPFNGGYYPVQVSEYSPSKLITVNIKMKHFFCYIAGVHWLIHGHMTISGQHL